MKNLLTLFVLFLGLGMANAQKPNFDETVKHINDFLVENPTYFKVGSSYSPINIMRAKKDGTVTFLYRGTSENVVGSLNLNNANSYEFIAGLLQQLYLGKVQNSFGIYLTEQSAARLEKMLRHLTTLCTEKDPFD